MAKRIPFAGISEPFSSLSHLFSALFFLIAGIRMIWQGRGNWGRSLSLIIYVFCTVFLFSMSGVYHLLEKGSTANYVLKILDHAGIYVMISGSFTPFQIILLRGYQRWVPLLLIWAFAITGLTLTAVFFDTIPEWLLLSFFIGMGWMGGFTILAVWKVSKRASKLIVLGGVFYTIGALFDFLRWPTLILGVFEAHELFHVAVSAAALVHFWAIREISHWPVSSHLTFIVQEMPDRVEAFSTTENIRFKGKSASDIRQLVKEWTHKSFHRAHLPKSIRFKFFKEDHWDIEDKDE